MKTYETMHQVQFEDIDVYGIIHHPKVLYYFERLRNSFFEKNGLNLNRLNYGFIIKNILIEYKAPLIMFDTVKISQITHKVRDYKFILKYLITKDEKIMVSAVIDFVVMEIATKSMILIPDNVSALLKSC